MVVEAGWRCGGYGKVRIVKIGANTLSKFFRPLLELPRLCRTIATHTTTSMAQSKVFCFMAPVDADAYLRTADTRLILMPACGVIPTILAVVWTGSASDDHVCDGGCDSQLCHLFHCTLSHHQLALRPLPVLHHQAPWRTRSCQMRAAPAPTC